MSKTFEGDRGFGKVEEPRKKEILETLALTKAEGETDNGFRSRVERSAMNMLHAHRERVLEETGVPAVGIHAMSVWKPIDGIVTIQVFRYR